MKSLRSRLPVLLDLFAPLLGLYGGQYLIAAIPGANGWGIAILGFSLVLLILRLYPLRTDHIANGLQFGLASLLNLPLALDVNNWKATASPWEMIALWSAGCAIAILAAARLAPSAIQLGLPSWERFDRRERITILLLVAGALVLRVPFIEIIPSGYDPDEASLGQFAWHAAIGRATDPFITGWATHPTLQFFFNSLYVKVFGRTFLAMRLPSAIVGSLVVASTYLLTRVGFGKRIALLAGVLALASDVAIHFSRLGLNNIDDALFMTWVLAALWAAGSSGHPFLYALAGAGAGLSQYYYFGNRAIPFVVIANLIVWLMADRAGVIRARHLLAASALVALVFVEPLLGHWLRNPNGLVDHRFLLIPFSDRLQQEALTFQVPEVVLWLQRIYDSLLVFMATPDHGGSYHSGQPMLHPLQVPLFVIALVYILARWRRPIHQGLVLWMIIHITLGSILITDAATFHRLLGVLPAGILLVAVGIDIAAAELSRVLQWSPHWRVGFTIAIVSLFVLVDVHYYYAIYNTRENYRGDVQEAVSLAALDYEQLQGQGAFVLVAGQGIDHESGHIYHEQIAYIAGDIFKGGVEFIDPIDTTKPVYFYVLPDRAAELPRLRERFGGGSSKEFRRQSDGLLLLTRYTVPASASMGY